MKKILYILILGFVLVSCVTTDGASQGKHKFVSRTEKIVLKGNATTGYMWNAVVDNSGVYEVADEDYEPYDAAPGMVGVGGEYTATLKSVRQGKGSVIFEYSRSWEDSPIKRIRYDIEVDERGFINVSEAFF